MIHIQFSVYDQAAQAYLPPWILPRIEMAQRTFQDCVNSKDHQFGAHPEDYTLFRLGTWDDETAQFTPEPNGPQTLGNGVEYVRQDDSTAMEGQPDGTESSSTQKRHVTPILPDSRGEDSQE